MKSGSAERFAEGTVNEVAPMAVRYQIDHWETIAEAWRIADYQVEIRELAVR